MTGAAPWIEDAPSRRWGRGQRLGRVAVGSDRGGLAVQIRHSTWASLAAAPSLQAEIRSGRGVGTRHGHNKEKSKTQSATQILHGSGTGIEDMETYGYL